MAKVAVSKARLVSPDGTWITCLCLKPFCILECMLFAIYRPYSTLSSCNVNHKWLLKKSWSDRIKSEKVEDGVMDWPKSAGAKKLTNFNLHLRVKWPFCMLYKLLFLLKHYAAVPYPLSVWNTVLATVSWRPYFLLCPISCDWSTT